MTAWVRSLPSVRYLAFSPVSEGFDVPTGSDQPDGGAACRGSAAASGTLHDGRGSAPLAWMSA